MQVTRVRYQFGSLYLRKGVKYSAWYFRYYDYGPDGKRFRRNLMIGTHRQYPSEAAAMRAVEALRLSINSGKPRLKPATMETLIARFIKEEMPERYSTRAAYSSLLRRWIGPQWGSTRVDRIEALAVEHWLKSVPLAPKTKANIRTNITGWIVEKMRRSVERR